jgi:hypothetical protein
MDRNFTDEKNQNNLKIYNYEKIIKGILFTILGNIALALIVALFMPKEYAVERSVINQPKDTVLICEVLEESR